MDQEYGDDKEATKHAGCKGLFNRYPSSHKMGKMVFRGLSKRKLA